MLGKRRKRNVTREELGAELETVAGANRSRDIQLEQMSAILNKTIQSLNIFMEYTNKTMEFTQKSQKLQLSRTLALEKWIRDFSAEIARQYEKIQDK